MKDLNEELARSLIDWGVINKDLSWSSRLVIIAAILLFTYICLLLFRYVLMPMVRRLTLKTKATWDDYLFSKEMMRGFGRLIPPIIIYMLLPLAFGDEPNLLGVLLKVCMIYLIFVSLWVVCTFLNSLYSISIEHETLKNRPLKGVYQMLKLVAVIIGVIIAVATLLNQDAATILAGLGASAAVLMLIFKDTILGLVAGVQLSANDMLRPGDWITMPKYGANGEVVEVSLTIVKVRNFDKTIITIPPYALVSDSFQNWRGMWDAGGRRIMRSINIDMRSIRFCTDEEKKTFAAAGWLDKEKVDEPVVNLWVFRTYVTNYLKNHPEVEKSFMTMVRQLQPTPEGLPLEIYCFTNTTVWPEYERIQAAIFDHVIAIIPQFGLRIFQRLTSSDFLNDRN